jgi:cytochrome c-type biogenesis protein CcmH/NrfG
VQQLDRVKNEQDVWDFMGGGMIGLSKAGQSPISCEIVKGNKYLCFRTRGRPKLNGVDYCVDSYFVLAGLHTYVVKAFTPDQETGFSIPGWEFGEPLGEQTESFTAVLEEIKARLDSGRSLLKAQARPSEPTTPIPQIKSDYARQSFLGADPESAGFKVGYAFTRYGIPLVIVGLVIRAWVRRVSRRTPITASRARYYRLLLLKMSWRIVIVFMLSMFVVMLSQNSPAISTQQAGEAGALAFLLLLVFCPVALFVTGWTQTKGKFLLSDGASSDSHVTPPPLPAAMPSVSRSTWWKRFLTVLIAASVLLGVWLVTSQKRGNANVMSDPDAVEGQQALDRRDGTAALKAFRNADKKFPDNSVVLYWLGRSYDMLHEQEMARTNYERAVKINPQNGLAWMYLGTSLVDTDPDRAISACKKATAIMPDSAHPWFILGLCYIIQNHASQAIPPLERAVQIKPDFVEAWSTLSGAYSAVGDYKQSSNARARFDELKSRKPTPTQSP